MSTSISGPALPVLFPNRPLRNKACTPLCLLLTGPRNPSQWTTCQGLPSTKRGNDCVFVVVDHFSKMVILAACKKSITMEATAKLFFERVWVHFGIPQTIISDRDSQFLNTFWSSLWSLLDTKLTKSTAFHPQMDGQTEVVNQMIVHILHMYNSKHPRTWDESLPYVQHNYNRAIHSSTDHNPFQVGLGFQPLGPMDVALPLAATQEDSSMLQLKLTKPPSSLRRSNTSTNRFNIFYRSPMPSTSSAMINTGCHTSFRWETKFGCTCRKNALQGLIRSFIHSIMDLTPSPRLWVTMLLSSTFPPSLACTQCSMWTSFDHIFHHYWTPQR
jgi:hypothetical protein